MSKISKKERLLKFNKSFMKYATYFGMNSWEYYITTDGTCIDCRACVDLSKYQDRIANVYLCKPMLDCTDEVFREEYDRIAFHEASEVLCMDSFGHLLEDVYSNRIMQEADHKIIRFLENTLYPKISGGK